MEVKFVRTRIGDTNDIFFICKINVKIGDIVLVAGNDGEEVKALVEDIKLLPEEKINFDLRLFNEVIKVIGNNKDLKLFKSITYPKVELDKEIDNLWAEDLDFLSYQINDNPPFINYSYLKADSKMTVYGTKLSGYIISRVGDVFDDNFVEHTFGYYNSAQLNYYLKSIKLLYHKYITNDITKDSLEEELRSLV